MLSRIVLLLTALAVAAGAFAHSRSESYSHWHVSGSTIDGTVTIPLREVMLLYESAESATPPRELFHDHVTGAVSVGAAGADCVLSSSNILQAASGFVRSEFSFDCGEATPDVIRFSAMFDVAPTHVHYGKLFRDGLQLGESLFTDAVRSWDIGTVGASDS